jgi:hypothetical protein
MSNQPELVLLHSGTFIEISTLQEFLYQNEIASIIRDDFQSSMMAGWVAPASYQNIKLFINQTDFVTAKFLLQKFTEEQDSTEI